MSTALTSALATSSSEIWFPDRETILILILYFIVVDTLNSLEYKHNAILAVAVLSLKRHAGHAGHQEHGTVPGDKGVCSVPSLGQQSAAHFVLPHKHSFGEPAPAPATVASPSA